MTVSYSGTSWRMTLRVRAMALCLVSAISGPLAAGSDGNGQPAQRMSIIIDDVGNNRHQGEAAIDLPGNITISVLPGLAHSRAMAELAHARGRQVMLHMPMDNHGRFPLGPMGLTMDMKPEEWQATLMAALDDVPQAAGVNNHMGSRLTELDAAMDVVMAELARRDLYFVDSLTSPRSIAYDTALSHGVPALKRQVFLDHEVTDAFISGQFSQALSIMDRYGHVVVIGHPYPETIDFLNWVLPLLEEAGIQLVTPDELMPVVEQPVPEEAILEAP